MRFSQELNENEIIENIRTTSTSEPDITKLRGSIIKKEYATGIEGMQDFGKNLKITPKKLSEDDF